MSTQKKFYGIVILVVWLFLLGTPTLQAGEITMPNGGFELVDDDGQPIDWFVDLVNPEKNKVAVDTKVYHSGKSSLYFEKGCSPKDYEGTTTPGLGSWMYMRSEGPGNFWLVIYHQAEEGIKRFTNEKGTTVLVAQDKSGEWKFYERVIEVPEGFTTLGFQLQMLEANKVWVDDLKVEELGEENF